MPMLTSMKDVRKTGHTWTDAARPEKPAENLLAGSLEKGKKNTKKSLERQAFADRKNLSSGLAVSGSERLILRSPL